MPQILGAGPLVLTGYSRLCAYSRSMAIGDKLAFKHITFNVKLQYPFNRRQVCVCARTLWGPGGSLNGIDRRKGDDGTLQVGMLVGGTGITPMIQASVALCCIAS